jgi:large-conductance mechanosensitive channel
MPIFLAGILSPLAILAIILTTVFAYLAWLKNERFKGFCFLCGLVGMMFATIVLVAVWFMALKIKTGEVTFSYLYLNVKGNISYGSFVSLILAFVVAIVSCAYNYFIDSGDEDYDDEDEDDEDEEDEDEEEEEEVKPRRKTTTTKAPATKSTTTKTTTTRKTTSTSTKSTTPKTPTKGTSTTRFIKKK